MCSWGAEAMLVHGQSSTNTWMLKNRQNDSHRIIAQLSKQENTPSTMPLHGENRFQTRSHPKMGTRPWSMRLDVPPVKSQRQCSRNISKQGSDPTDYRVRTKNIRWHLGHSFKAIENQPRDLAGRLSVAVCFLLNLKRSCRALLSPELSTVLAAQPKTSALQQHLPQNGSSWTLSTRITQCGKIIVNIINDSDQLPVMHKTNWQIHSQKKKLI